LRFDLLFFFLFNMRRLCCHSCSYAGCCVFETTEFLLDTSLCPFLNFLLVAFRAIVAAVLFVLGKERSHALPILRVRSNNGESHALREGGSIGGGGGHFDPSPQLKRGPQLKATKAFKISWFKICLKDIGNKKLV
jgi:hypothetical protein